MVVKSGVFNEDGSCLELVSELMELKQGDTVSVDRSYNGRLLWYKHWNSFFGAKVDNIAWSPTK